MSHPYHHAVSSAKRFHGVVEAYQPIHDWFDQTKACFADGRHRAILHSSFGVFLCEQFFGTSIDNGTGRQVPVRLIGEQHVREDLGRIPSVQDWLSPLPFAPWMRKSVANTDEDDIPVAPKITVTLSRDEAYALLAGAFPTQAVRDQLLTELRACEATPT